jgi:hypothetical protein
MLLVNIQLDELQKFEQINVPAHPTLYICMHGLFLASKAINISTFLIEGDIYIYIYIYIYRGNLIRAENFKHDT